jgi:hypothetical protein
MPQTPTATTAPRTSQHDGRLVTLGGGIQVITSPDRRMTTITDNGHVTTLTVKPGGVVDVTVDGQPLAVDPAALSGAIERVASASSRVPPRVRETAIRVHGRPLSEDDILAAGMLGGVAVSIVALFVLYLLMRVARGLRRRTAAPPAPNVAPRMDRLEQAVEGIALEIERVAEAQRFSARLLAERLPDPASVRRPVSERVITPH